MAQPEFKVSGIVLDTPDPRELAGFYSQASSNSHHNIRGDGAGLPPIEGWSPGLCHQIPGNALAGVTFDIDSRSA